MLGNEENAETRESTALSAVKEERGEGMEMIEPDGSRRQLHPGEKAQIDQLGAKWRELTTQLMALHMRAKAALLDDSQCADLAQFHQALRGTLDQAFPKGDYVESLYSYIMYLIDLLVVAQDRDDFIIQAARRVSDAMNHMINYMDPVIASDLEQDDDRGSLEGYR